MPRNQDPPTFEELLLLAELLTAGVVSDLLSWIREVDTKKASGEYVIKAQNGKPVYHSRQTGKQV